MLAPEKREQLIEAYEENERAALRMVKRKNQPFLLLDDIRLCREMAAEECGVTDAEAREVLLDHFTLAGAG